MTYPGEGDNPPKGGLKPHTPEASESQGKLDWASVRESARGGARGRLASW